MVWDDSLMLRRGNTTLTATEVPETHYCVVPGNARRNALWIHIVIPIAATGSPTSIAFEAMTCPDSSDPTVNGNWVSFTQPAKITLTTFTAAIEYDLIVPHVRYKYLALKSTVVGGTNPSWGNVTAGVVVGTSGAGYLPE